MLYVHIFDNVVMVFSDVFSVHCCAGGVRHKVRHVISAATSLPSHAE